MANLWLHVSSDPLPWQGPLSDWGYRVRPGTWEELGAQASPDAILADSLPAHLPLAPLVWVGDAPPPSDTPAVVDWIRSPEEPSAPAALERAVEIGKLRRENDELRRLLDRQQGPQLVGQSRSFLNLLARLDRLSHAKAPVLITGEKGTGKRTVAREIHRRGPRGKRPFIEMSGAVQSPLLESQLFGHTKGAFPGALGDKPGLVEQAQGGTLYLDAISQTSPDFQLRLRRLLSERTYEPLGSEEAKPADMRVIVAEDGDLRQAVRDGRFREDLFFTLNTISLHLAPLRQRPEDVEPLVETFLQRAARTHRKRVLGMSAEALARLTKLPWAGNAAELERWVEQGVARTEGPWVELEHLGPDGKAGVFSEVTREMPTLDELEKRYIRLVLEKTKGKKDEAASILGINRRTLYRKEREYGW